MLIGLIGPTCAGKHEVAHYLTTKYGFEALTVTPSTHDTTNDDSTYRSFRDIGELVMYTTQRWRSRFVVCGVDAIVGWQGLRRRPSFLLVAVDAPVKVRYERWVGRHGHGGGCNGDGDGGLMRFVELDDERLYGLSTSLIQSVGDLGINGTVGDGNDNNNGTRTVCGTEPCRDRTVTQSGWAPTRSDTTTNTDTNTPLIQLMSMADVRVLNTGRHITTLHTTLTTIDLTNPSRLRPDWDTYFMSLCDLAAQRSNCMKRRVGCILVADLRIIATGYNGTPRGVRNCNEGGCGRCNGGASRGVSLDLCLCLHAEENALLEAGRERINSGGKSILYCNTCPCIGCAKKVVQAGVHEVVYAQTYAADDATAALMREAGIVLRQHAGPVRLA